MALRGGGLIIEAWPRTVKTAEASKAARKGARGATAGGMSKVACQASPCGIGNQTHTCRRGCADGLGLLELRELTIGGADSPEKRKLVLLTFLFLR